MGNSKCVQVLLRNFFPRKQYSIRINIEVKIKTFPLYFPKYGLEKLKKG